jgi:DNA repair protein RadD
MKLRPYQVDLVNAINQAWASGKRNVLARLPTGGGKTLCFSHIVHDEIGAVAVLAHRAELVSQMALALAREDVRHRVIGPPALSALCRAAQIEELGRHFVDPGARVGVVSVQSLKPEPWLAQVKLWVMDESHHLLAENLFGRAVALFVNARGLGVTATPGRADGKGLGRHADGVMDVLVEGPEACELITMGYLSKYRIFAPPNNLHREDIPVTGSGDFSPTKLREATKKSTVTGDVVDHYCRHASGKLGLTFADSIENAKTIVEKFRARGVTAEVLTGATPDALRASILGKFKRREVMQIASVALIDEGFDCPGVEVVSDAAATESFNRFAQRFGRGLRVLEGKEYMMYFDHVGNVLRHGLPDAPRTWSLNRRDKRASSKAEDVEPVRTCSTCAGVYSVFAKVCPYCAAPWTPALRGTIEQVEGDLMELDAAVLARLRGEIARVDGLPRVPQHLDGIAARGAVNAHLARQMAQAGLREALQLWGGWRKHHGEDESQAQRRFWHRFGVDVASAMVLGAREAHELELRVTAHLLEMGVTSAA